MTLPRAKLSPTTSQKLNFQKYETAHHHPPQLTDLVTKHIHWAYQLHQIMVTNKPNLPVTNPTNKPNRNKNATIAAQS